MLRLHRLIRPKHVVRRFVKDDSEKFLNLEKFKEQEKQEREKPLSEKYPTIEVKPREISDEPNWIQKRWQKFRLWIERSNMDIKVAILVAFLFFLYNVNYYRTWNVHENNGYHLKALEKLNQNIRLKYAFGGNITFDKFEKKGESCLTKDVARVMFYVTGPNKKVGLCLCESIMDEDKLEWIINRVYLDFWANPNQPPIYMQIYPEKLIIEADAPTARDAFVRSQIIQAPEPKFVDNSDAEAVRRQKLLEAVMRGESAVPSRSRNDKPEIQAERSQAEKKSL